MRDPRSLLVKFMGNMTPAQSIASFSQQGWYTGDAALHLHHLALAAIPQNQQLSLKLILESWKEAEKIQLAIQRSRRLATGLIE